MKNNVKKYANNPRSAVRRTDREISDPAVLKKILANGEFGVLSTVYQDQPFAIPAGMEEREKEIRSTIKLPESYRQLLNNGFQAPEGEPRVYRMYRKNWGLNNPEVGEIMGIAIGSTIGLYIDDFLATAF